LQTNQKVQAEIIHTIGESSHAQHNLVHFIKPA